MSSPELRGEERRFNRLKEEAVEADREGDLRRAEEKYRELGRLAYKFVEEYGDGEKKPVLDLTRAKIREIEEVKSDLKNGGKGSSRDSDESEWLDQEEDEEEGDVSDEEVFGERGSEDSGGRFDVLEPRHSFDDVVGMSDVKQEFRDKIFSNLQDPEGRSAYNIGETVNGIILYGAPGVGKSFVSEAAAGELDGQFFTVGAGEIMDRYVGESESNIRELVGQAVESEPAIVVIDEIDRLASDRRERHGSSAKADMISAFLDEIENLSGSDSFVVGTTNNIDRIDDAFLRPGRFAKQIFVPLPDEEMRLELVRDWIRDVDGSKVASSDIDLRRLARETEGYTVADLVEDGGLMYEAAVQAYNDGEPIQQRHFISAYRDTEPSVDNPEKWKGR